MFDWLTKPYIKWNVIDTILCYVEVAILLILILIISAKLLEFKDRLKQKNKKGDEKNEN